MKPNVLKPLTIFLGIVFAVSVFTIITKKITLPAPFSRSANSVQQKTKVAPNLNPTGNRIIISYNDLNLFFQDCCSNVLKDVKSERDVSSIKISGKSSFPFSANFQGNIQPIVENDKLSFQITKLTLGKVDMPQILANKIIDLAQKYADIKINNKFKVKDAKITSRGLEVKLK